MRIVKNNNRKKVGYGYYIVGGIFILILLSVVCPFRIVNAGERGVVMRFGKVQNYILGEGLHTIVPIITTVKKINVRMQQNTFNADASSKDLQMINTELAVNWRLDPLEVNKIYQQLGDEKLIINGIITPAVYEVLKTAMAKRTAEEVITKRTELKEEIDSGLKKRLSQYKIIVDDISLVQFSFSPEFSKAVEAKQIAEQEAKQAEFIAKKATQEALAEINRAKGQAEAQRLQRLTITPELLQKQAIEKWDGRFPSVMGGNDSLPLINIKPSSSGSAKQQP